LRIGYVSADLGWHSVGLFMTSIIAAHDRQHFHITCYSGLESEDSLTKTIKADADGPAWTDARIAEACCCRRETVQRLRQRFVESGFQETLDAKTRAQPPTPKLLNGEQEAKIIATRLGPPPKGYANWTLRLLSRKVVELEIVNQVSYETVRRTLKQTV